MLAAALVVSACGDDDDDDDGGGSASAAPAPTGAPIDIGYTNTENSPAGSFPDLRAGAEAAVEHINQDLGGVNGRPIAMETCINNASGESSIGCANKFVQGNKVAVSYGFDFGATGGWPIYTDAGIPIVGGVATDPVQLASPNSFLFFGGIASAAPAVSRYIGETLRAKKVAIVGIDIPAARLSVDQFNKPVLAKYGITDVNAVYESPTAADWTPALSKANEGNPDAILAIVGSSACSKVMQATTGLGIDPKKVFYVQVCAGQDTLDAAGIGANGIVIQSPMLAPGSDDPQVEEWRDAMRKYRADANLGPDAQAGFSNMMNLYATLMKIQGDITPATITAALKAANNEPNFMAHPYTCDGNQFPTLTAICNTSERLLRYENGEFSDVTGEWFNGAADLMGG